MRPLGFLTQAVHLNAWGADDQLWIAKRAPHKNSDPNFWDTLVGGLAAAGEDLETTLVRGGQEGARMAGERGEGPGAVGEATRGQRGSGSRERVRSTSARQ